MAEIQKQTADPEVTAANIRRLFIKAKTEQMGKVYKPSAKFNRHDFWVAAADNCIRLGADPLSYVRAAFTYNNVPGGPFPHQMAGNAASRWYQWYDQLFNSKEVDCYQDQIKRLIADALKRALTNGRKTLSNFLLDDEIRSDDIPAFVRILLLANNPRIVERWGKEAYMELKMNQRLLTLLEEMGYAEQLQFLNDIEKRMI